MKTIIERLLFLILLCINSQAVTAQKPIIIDVDKALKNEQNLKLSQLVDKAEMIELEGKKGAYLNNLYYAHVGAKYIIIGDKQPSIILVFGRNGKFLRQISSEGQGPGEYTSLNAVAVSPDEKFIIFCDYATQRIIAYNPEGKFLKEVKIKEGSPSRIIDNIWFIDNEHFAAQVRRPYRVLAGYNRVQIYNTNLEPVISMLPVNDASTLTLQSMFQCELIANPTGVNYFEMIENTIYQIDNKMVPEPLYQLSIKKNPLTADIFLNPDRGEQRKRKDECTYLWSVYNTPGFIISNGYSIGKPILIVHDKKSATSFSVPVKNPCYNSEMKRPSIENDIFGIEPVYLDKYQVGSDYYITSVSLDETARYRDLNCLKSLKVSQPEIRDRIVKIAENQTGTENVILVLLHMKK